MEHKLKTWPEFFQATIDGVKRFEYRQDDRGFKEDDTLRLMEWNPQTKQYTGRVTKVNVKYILRGMNLPEGYCIMSVSAPLTMTVRKEARYDIA